ncbi:uncharacterized protein HD556DRAFT_101708 [Suillus plorans]|uniref:Glutathione S-transferase n=1 Tax=Suillus plorans TaxID=116603 RepID=A0A9P7DB20_9AGAM|nr:uncharacterized protein HD556DRAFT_101708 [Suillus plorans]KAG1785628.1 hypothetical protein HD556DRAFT_101708 [Suillus plorans]
MCMFFLQISILSASYPPSRSRKSIAPSLNASCAREASALEDLTKAYCAPGHCAKPIKRPEDSDIYTVSILGNPNTGALIMDSLEIASYLKKTYGKWIMGDAFSYADVIVASWLLVYK